MEISIAQLEHLLGVKISVDMDRNNNFAGIHVTPGDSIDLNIKVTLTGVARR